MLRLGSPPAQAREMDLDDIFLCRLKLMLIMTRAFLNGWPIGEHRRKAIIENARHVESESIDLGGSAAGTPTPNMSAPPSEHDHLFLQRVKLLAIMIKAAAKGYPMGTHRTMAMRENLESICRALMINSSDDEMAFLKVA